MSAEQSMTLNELRKYFEARVGGDVVVTNHFIKRENHPCFGTRQATVTKVTSTSLYLDDSRIEWPKASQLVVNDYGVMFLGGGIGQESHEPFLTIEAS